MQVNYVQVAYVLGISPKSAKLMMLPYIDKDWGGVKYPAAQIRLIAKDDFVDSSLLKARFRHPSLTLDGKDKIEYIIRNLQTKDISTLRKRIVEDMACIKAGKIAGKYKPLLSILSQPDIDKLNDLIRKRRILFLQSGGVFPERKPMKGLK